MQQAYKTMSPLLIPGADFAVKLDDPRRNRDHTAAFMAKGTQDFTLPSLNMIAGYKLRRSLSGDQIRMVYDGETVYYVKLKQSSHIIPGVTHITQIGVWRTRADRHDAAAHGLARAMFDWLIENYNVVVSDTEQTGDGASFWRGRVMNAIERADRFVYSWDGTDEDAEPQPVTDVSRFLESWPYFWGADRDEHTHRIFIITGKPLAGH